MANKTRWDDLRSKFRKLKKVPEAFRLTATYVDGEWHLGNWPRDPYDKKRLQESFNARACDGIELVGEEGCGAALDQWLDRLRANGRGKRITTGESSESYYIQDAVQASIEYCAAMDEREAEAATAQSANMAATWEEVQITFITERDVAIRANGQTENKSYIDMGLADKRRGLPNKQWEMLYELAAGGGNIPRKSRTPAKAGSMDKCKDRLCKALEELFRIPSEPNTKAMARCVKPTSTFKLPRQGIRSISLSG